MSNPNIGSYQPLAGTKRLVNLKARSQCIIKTDELMLQGLPGFRWGCMLIPVRQSNGQLYLYVTENISEAASKKQISDLEQHRCLGS